MYPWGLVEGFAGAPGADLRWIGTSIITETWTGEHEVIWYREYRRSGDQSFFGGAYFLSAGHVFDLEMERIDAALLPINGRDERRRSNGIPGNFTFREAVQVLFAEIGVCYRAEGAR